VADFPNIRRGTRWEDTKAREWQNLMDAAHGIASITVQPPLQQYRTGRHVNIRLGPMERPVISRGLIGGVGVPMYLARAATLYPDHLVCRAWSTDADSYDPVPVAKWWPLQRTRYDNVTRDGVRYEYDTAIRRKAIDVTNEANWRWERILPPYHVNDPLLVIGLGVPILTFNDTEISLLCVDSRVWTTVYERPFGVGNI